MSRKYIIVLILLVLPFTGCNEVRPVIVVDNYVSFLELDEDQEKKVRPKLEEIKEFVEEYYATEEETSKENTNPISKEERLRHLTELLEKVSPLMGDIGRELDSEQYLYWARSEVFYFYNKARSDLARYYLNDNQLDYKLGISQDMIDGTREYIDREDYIDSWSIYFGKGNFPFSRKNYNRSIKGSSNDRHRFPIGIQATLVTEDLVMFEKELAEDSSEDIPEVPFFELRVVLSSILHENFVDIDRWVVFLETPGRQQVEPVKIVRRNREWFSERGMLYTDRIPEFLLRNPALPSTENAPRRQGVQYNTYYQLFFPMELNSGKVLSFDKEFLRVVFLDEVGSRKSAIGTWVFER